jgi:glycerophosphoryl diester phosphodiesterase
MYTYKRSVEAGVPVLEIDIQRTADKILVLSHDNKRWFGTISKMTYKELCEVCRRRKKEEEEGGRRRKREEEGGRRKKREGEGGRGRGRGNGR